MSDPLYQQPVSAPARGSDSTNLADILERVLDKGIVIAGDIRIDLLNVELLTIKLRLIVASVERAEAMGIDWWRTDRHLTSDTTRLTEENRALKDRIARLEDAMGRTHSQTDSENAAPPLDPRLPRDG